MVGRQAASAARRAAGVALAVLLGLAPALPARAEPAVGVRLRLLETLVREAAGDWALFSLGAGRVSLSTSSENVKAELAVDALLGDGLSASLARALVAVRFPGVRLTAGKARLSWGEGTAFNAADLLYGSSSAAGLDLTADVLRDDASWLAALNVPLGRFSFVEIVALPPALDVAGFVANPAAPLPDWTAAAAGGRMVGKLAGIKTEVDYLFSGADAMHRLAASLQGNLFVDWHLSAGTGFPSASPVAADLLDQLRLSAGVFHLQRLGPRARLSMRLEVLAAPGGEWQEVEPAGPAAPVYGLLLYPELALALDSDIAITARALVSPVDASAVVVPGISVSLHKGLSFFGMASLSFGDSTDSWSGDRRGGVAFLAGCAYTYWHPGSARPGLAWRLAPLVLLAGFTAVAAAAGRRALDTTSWLAGAPVALLAAATLLRRARSPGPGRTGLAAFAACLGLLGLLSAAAGVTNLVTPGPWAPRGTGCPGAGLHRPGCQPGLTRNNRSARGNGQPGKRPGVAVPCGHARAVPRAPGHGVGAHGFSREPGAEDQARRGRHAAPPVPVDHLCAHAGDGHHRDHAGRLTFDRALSSPPAIRELAARSSLHSTGTVPPSRPRSAMCWIRTARRCPLPTGAGRDSFEGQDYSRRPYVAEALAGRHGSYFAVGVTSGVRGYYASAPVRAEDGRLLGIVAIKQEIDHIASTLGSATPYYVVDPDRHCLPVRGPRNDASLAVAASRPRSARRREGNPVRPGLLGFGVHQGAG